MPARGAACLPRRRLAVSGTWTKSSVGGPVGTTISPGSLANGLKTVDGHDVSGSSGGCAVLTQTPSRAEGRDRRSRRLGAAVSKLSTLDCTVCSARPALSPWSAPGGRLVSVSELTAASLAANESIPVMAVPLSLSPVLFGKCRAYRAPAGAPPACAPHLACALCFGSITERDHRRPG